MENRQQQQSQIRKKSEGKFKMKIFEDYFSEYQADMVSICLEYVNQNADYI